MAVRPAINPPYMGRHCIAMPVGFAGLGSLNFPNDYASWLFYASGKYRDLGQASQSQTLMKTLWPSLDGSLQSEFMQYIGPAFHLLTGSGAPKGYQVRAFLIFLDPVTGQPYTPVFQQGKLIGAVPRLGVNFEFKNPAGAMAGTMPFTSAVNLSSLLNDLAFKNKKTGFAVLSDTFLKMIKDPAVWKTVAVAVGAPLLVSAVVAPAVVGAGAGAGTALPAAFTATPQALTASYYGGATLAPAAVGTPIVTGLTAAVGKAPLVAAATTVTAPPVATVTAGGAAVAPSLLKTATTTAQTLTPFVQTAAQVAPLVFAPSGGGGAPAPVSVTDTGQQAAPSPAPSLPSWGVPAMLLGGALLVAYFNS